MTASDQNATTDVIPVVFKSLKAARAAGYHDLRDEEYGGEQTQVEGRTLVRDPQVAVSKTAWGERGFRVRRGETPHAEVSGTVGGKNRSWLVYRDDQVEPKRVIRRLEPKRVPLLAAVWTINRTAKRFRDAATRHYHGGRHGFAGDASQRKEMLYARKGQALHHLMADGTLQHAGYHRFPGNKWAEVLTGAGFTFHRPCETPKQKSGKALSTIEAKPRGAREPRLCDAIFTLDEFLDGKALVDIYEWPPRERRNCGSEREEDYDGDEWDSTARGRHGDSRG
jgi:hypothetical protein